jgi:hypothetical protein
MTEEDLTMSTISQAAKSPRAMAWAGWVMSGIVVLFFLMDAVMKLLDVEPVRQAQQQLGWPIALDRTIGLINLICVALYVVPRTAVLGAILMTGVLGGAIASHLRLLDPLFTHILFGGYIGLLAWAASGCGTNACAH